MYSSSRHGRLLTPRADRCGVAGVMRRVVLREARRAGIDVEEGDLDRTRIWHDADEVFLTNARDGHLARRARWSRASLQSGTSHADCRQLMAPLLEEPRRWRKVAASASGAALARARRGSSPPIRWLQQAVSRSRGRRAWPRASQLPREQACARCWRSSAQQGVLTMPLAVEFTCASRGLHPKIKAGTYDIPPRASAAQIVRMLEQGDRRARAAHGRRGLDVRGAAPSPGAPSGGAVDAARQVRRRGDDRDRQRRAASGRAVLSRTPTASRRSTSDVEILKLAYASMQRVLDEAWQQRREGLPVRTPDEALILARSSRRRPGSARSARRSPACSPRACASACACSPIRR